MDILKDLGTKIDNMLNGTSEERYRESVDSVIMELSYELVPALQEFERRLPENSFKLEQVGPERKIINNTNKRRIDSRNCISIGLLSGDLWSRMTVDVTDPRHKIDPVKNIMQEVMHYIQSHETTYLKGNPSKNDPLGQRH